MPYLKTMEIYCLSGQETRSPKPGCQQGHAPFRGSTGILLFHSSSFGWWGNPWLVAASVCLIFTFLSLHFELWCWRRLFRVPWTARRSNESILKEISPEYSLEGLILRLKLQYFSHLMGGTDSLERFWCWERLKAGGEGDGRGWDGWMASLT